MPTPPPSSSSSSKTAKKKKKKEKAPSVSGERLAVMAVQACVRDGGWASAEDGEVLGAFSRLCLALRKLASVTARGASARPPGPTDASRADLREWVRGVGGTWHANARLEGWRDGQSRVVAADEGIRAGETIFSIPFGAMLTCRPLTTKKEQKRDGEDVVSSFLDRSGLEGTNPTTALALRLAYEALEKKNMSPYVLALPPSFDVPLSWGPRSAAELVGASPKTLRRALNSKRAAAATYVELWKEANTADSSNLLARAFRSDDRTNFLSWDDFEWALGAASTRQNAVPLRRDHSQDTGTTARLALVPAWDMCNHDPRGPSSSVVTSSSSSSSGNDDDDDDEPRLELVAEEAYASGAEVRMCYGTRSTLEFAVYNGFLVKGERASSDAVDIDVQFPSTSPSKALASNLLRKAGLPTTNAGSSGVFFRGALVVVAQDTARGDVGPDDALRAVGLAAVVDKPRLAHLMRSGQAFPEWRPLDDRHSADAADFLRRVCDAELARRVATNAIVRLTFSREGDDGSSPEDDSRRDLARALLHFEFDFLRAASKSLAL